MEKNFLPSSSSPFAFVDGEAAALLLLCFFFACVYVCSNIHTHVTIKESEEKKILWQN